MPSVGQLLYDAVCRSALVLAPANADVEKLGLTDDQKDAAARHARLNAIREAGWRGDVLEWGKLLFPEKFPLDFCNELHGYFVEIMTAEFTNTEAPRNHAKTTIKCFLIPIFLALLKPELFRHYMNVQATGTKALAVNTAIKNELETNEDLREIYGDQMGRRWTDEQFVLKNGVIFSAVSAGQSIRGYQRNNIRPDYIIVDDLYNEDDINHPDSTIKKNDWFWGTLYPARAKHRKCSIHMQGTAINTEDLLEKLKKQDRWKSRTFRAIKDEKKKTVLWPELNSYESLLSDRKDMGSVIFNREMQNERRDDATAIIKRGWIKEYDPRDLKFENGYFLALTVLGCDPSIGEKSENDATGVALVRKAQYSDGRGNDFYIEGLWNEHLSLNKRVALLEIINGNLPKNFKVNETRVEAIAGFKDFVQELIRRTNLPVKEIDAVKDKITNLENKSHYFENGKVFLNKNLSEEIKDMLVHQLTTNHPKHDDLRDAVLLCLDDISGTWGFVR